MQENLDVANFSNSLEVSKLEIDRVEHAIFWRVRWNWQLVNFLQERVKLNVLSKDTTILVYEISLAEHDEKFLPTYRKSFHPNHFIPTLKKDVRKCEGRA